MDKAYRTIGKSILRTDAVDKVKGLAAFSADIDLSSPPLVLKVFRSGIPHAKIIKIHTEKALAIEGVLRVFTAKDIPGKNLLGIINKDQPLLAADKVRSAADAVALVAAETEEAALKALDAISVEYEKLPAVFSPEDAMAADAPLIHPKGNQLAARFVKKGDVEAIFQQCASVIERTYRTSMVEHNYLEPDAGIGYLDVDGTLVIYASTQNPHYDHKEIVTLLGVPDDKVRIIQATTGGGFGSKLDLNTQGFIGLALYHLKRAVRCVYTREEAYLATAKRHPLTIHMKTGADATGRLRALRAKIICDTGAYGSYGIAVMSRAAVHATGPYAFEAIDVESLCIYTNNPFCGAMRGFGTPQIAFAHESQIDLHAEDLKIDPLQIRLLNALRPGSETATGQVLTHSVGISQCIEAIRPYYESAISQWATAEHHPYKKRGIGVGAMWYGIGNTGVQNPSTARVEMDLSGAVTLYTGCADIGQGSTTILTQILAETLGLSPEQINVVAADTQFTTNAGATSASRQTYISGNAVKDAADKLSDVLRTEAVNKLRVSKKSLVFADGCVAVATNHEKCVDLASLAKRIHAKGAPLVWQGYFDPETVPLSPTDGQGIPYGTYAFACQMAQVVVDVLTGEITVERIVAAHDVGKAIHPENVKGQICGGTAMGIGFALMEEFKPGETKSMKDYVLPTSMDMPEVIPIIIESHEPSGPFGAKGVGEPALIPTAPAILNAISRALNQRIYTLPANLERVLDASIQSGHFAGRKK
ncbi:MAG: aldehyde oxidase [Desulfatitalea sp. BRH_c12]|nr:MAG: aldehyde oxidase [Desulfatitalea sp. BRH_c12]